MSEPSEHEPQLRQVALPLEKTIRRKKKLRSFPGGIVADLSADFRPPAPLAVQTTDLLFPPNVPRPIAVSNGGGAIGTNLPVQLIFWGSAWNQPSTTPSAGTILGSVQTILGGPWMSGLRQYGIRRCNFANWYYC